MSRKAIIPLVLGLGIGLLAVKFIVESIQKAQASGAARQTVTVVWAKQDIAAHEEIGKDMVETVDTADSLFAPKNDRIEKLEQAIGRVAAKSISKNAPVLLSMLAPEGTKPGMVGRIPPGFRAVSVKIDEVAAAGYQIQPGDWVDVIVVMDIDTANKGKKETIAEVILQHVQVAAIGHGTNPDQEPSGTKVKPAKSATLLVPEADVPKLHLAGTRGKIALAMRGEDDTVIGAPATALSGEIMKMLGVDDAAPKSTDVAPVVASAHRPVQEDVEPHPVLVFHGTTRGNQPMQVERITFEGPKSPKIIEVGQGAPTRASATMSTAKSSAARSSRAASGDSREPAEPDTGDEGTSDDGE